MKKSTLAIKQIEFNSERRIFDFFIDDIALSELMNISRQSLMFSSFDLDYFNVDPIKFSKYNRSEVIRNSVDVFLGIKSPFNQLLTDRITLYRCHCGSDYCGVISFKLVMSESLVTWKEIKYENEDTLEGVFYDDEELYIKPIDNIIFERKAYEFVFNNYLHELESF